MLFKILVETAFWAFAIQLFFIIVDLFSPFSFGPQIYSAFGYLLFYIYTFPIVFLLKWPEKKKP